MSETVKEEERLEDIFTSVEELITKMEGDISMDDAFAAYEQGMKKLKICNDKIETIEKKMLVLNEEGQLEEF